MKTGFTFYLNHKDYFVQTEAKHRTTDLCIRILRQLRLPSTGACANELKRRLQPATLDIITTPSGSRFYSITGDGFGVVDPVSSGDTIVLALR